MKDKGAILVVEGTPADLELLVDTLTAEGYQVLPAENGELALASVAARPPELILLDIQIPGLDGFEVCRRLKARPESRNIPVVFITVSGDSAEQVAGLKLGAVDYITKPFQRAELLVRVQNHLELHRLRVRLERQAADLRLANEQLQTELADRQRAELEIQRQAAFARFNPNPVLELSAAGEINYLNAAAGEMVRTLGWKNPSRMLPPNTAALAHECLATGQPKLRVETPIGPRVISWSFFPVKVTNTVHCYAGDITERKQLEAYGKMGREVLQILNEPGELPDSIQRVIAALKTGTGFDAVGIRLQEGDDFPYFAQKGFPKGFLLTENTLIERAADGGVCRDKDGNICLECTCGLVISGKTDPLNPLFTRGGSCWTNDSFPLLDIPPGEDPRHHPRNQCVHHGYASVALIPIRNQDRIVGLIHLNDRRKGRFTLTAVGLLEGIASHIGAALMRRRAEEVLRQRVKLQDQLVHIAAAVPGMIYSLLMRPDGSTRMPYASGILSDIFGLQPKDVIEDAAPVFSLIHPDDLGHVMATIAESARTLNPWRDDFRVCHTRLGEIWVEGHSVPQREPDGSVLWHGFVQNITERKRAQIELEKALASVKSLSGLLPICAGCKKIRDDKGYWSQVESYIQKHSEATFTHGLCPDCIKKYYPELEETGPGNPTRQTP